MKKFLLSALLAVLSLPLFAQSYSAGIPVTYGLVNYQGELIQFNFPLSFGVWNPAGRSGKYDFKGNNVALVQTVNGVSRFYLSATSDICKVGCLYVGAVNSWNGQPQIENVIMPDGSIVQRVSGQLIGTFTFEGDAVPNISARFYFESYAADVSAQVWPNAAGGLTIELGPNTAAVYQFKAAITY